MAVAAFTAEQFETWIRARDAYRQAKDAFGSHAAYTIIGRLKTGLLTARAKHVFLEPDGTKSGFELLIPRELWATFESDHQYLSQSTLWNTGEMEVHTYRGRPQSFKFYDVRFDPDGVSEMLPPRPVPPQPKPVVVTPTAPPIQQSANTNSETKVGRPKHDYWEDLWADIAAQLFVGDLKPNRQADLEKAMLEWADRNGKDMAVGSARERARRLWKLIEAKDKK